MKGRHPDDAPARARGRAGSTTGRPSSGRTPVCARPTRAPGARGLVESPDPADTAEGRRYGHPGRSARSCGRVVEAAWPGGPRPGCRSWRTAATGSGKRKRAGRAGRIRRRASSSSLQGAGSESSSCGGDARRAWSESRYGDQNELERGGADGRERAGRGRSGSCPSTELREFQQREQARYPDRGGAEPVSETREQRRERKTGRGPAASREFREHIGNPAPLALTPQAVYHWNRDDPAQRPWSRPRESEPDTRVHDAAAGAVHPPADESGQSGTATSAGTVRSHSS